MIFPCTLYLSGREVKLRKLPYNRSKCLADPCTTPHPGTRR